jgi:hypothetical protein
MRLMAALTGVMTGRRRRELLLVARAARAGLLTVVRVVAADAFGVRGHHPGHLRRVTRATLCHGQERPMRQPRVAILAILVPRQARHFRQFFAVTIEARAMIGSVAHKIVRRVAAFAVDAGVKARVLGGRLMAATTRARRRMSLRSVGMGIVTTHAASRGPNLRMIRVNVTVAFAASLLGSTAHVVRCVATRALLMARRVSAAQNREVLMARAAWGRLVFGELVRAVTTHTLPMPSVEQRGRGHDRRKLSVTRYTRIERIGCRGVLLLVTRRASLNHRFTGGGVGRRHVFVAVGAGGRDGFGVFMRPVAVEALFGVVNLHGGRRALRNQVTVSAVTGGVGVGVERLLARPPF